MAPSCALKLLGGISAILAGALLVVAHVPSLLAPSEPGTSAGPLFALLGHAAVILAFIAMYQAGGGNGRLGRIGILLTVIGTAALYVMLYLNPATSPAQVATVPPDAAKLDRLYHSLVPRLIHMLSSLVYGVGIVAFGVALIKAGVLPRLGAAGLVAGTLAFGAGSLADVAGPAAAVVGASVMGAGFIWLGSALILMGEAQYRQYMAIELAGLYR